jgi:hypothetical protein
MTWNVTVNANCNRARRIGSNSIARLLILAGDVE